MGPSFGRFGVLMARPGFGDSGMGFRTQFREVFRAKLRGFRM